MSFTCKHGITSGVPPKHCAACVAEARVEQLESELAQLRARLEEVGRDGERYRLLRGCSGMRPEILDQFLDMCKDMLAEPPEVGERG